MTRANFNSARTTSRTTGRCFLQDTWRVNDRLTINPGLRYEQQTLSGTFETLTALDGEELSDFPLKNNWAPRIGVVYDVLGNGQTSSTATTAATTPASPTTWRRGRCRRTPASPAATTSTPT